MPQITYLKPLGLTETDPLGARRKAGKLAAGVSTRAQATLRDAPASSVVELAEFEADCIAALRILRNEQLGLSWISVPLPVRALYEPATLARLQRLATEEAAGFAKLRFEIDHRYFVAELEHVVAVQASLGAARLALAVQLEPGAMPLSGELSRGGVKLLYAPAALSAAAATDCIAREELRYIARLAQSLGIESAVHSVRNRAALTQCQEFGIDYLVAQCQVGGARQGILRPRNARQELN